MLEDLHTTLAIDENKVAEALEFDCSRWSKEHTCMEPFRQAHNALRNWRVLWRSIPASMRREALISMYAKPLAEHVAAGGDKRDFRMKKYSIFGVDVCLDAFCNLTGIGRWSLTTAREAAINGHRSSLSRGELPMEMSILPGARPVLYLEARAWLEVYVELVAESSSMKIEFYLPAGRKRYYFEQMAYERTCQGMDHCSLQVFLDMWRTELPFIIICGSVCKFVKCGCCEYLRMQIDLTPRSDTVLMNALRTRLGQHFQFQSAQRLALGREEERCI